MIVKTDEMPTRGYLTPLIGQVNVYPITFGELLKYLGDEQLTKEREYIRSLQWLISKDVRIGDLSILDADYLLYVFRAISSSTDAKLTVYGYCEKCNKRHGKQIKLNSIEFYDVDEKNLNIESIKILNRDIKIRYTTINQFIDFFGKLNNKQEQLGIDTIKLASMLSTRDPRESIDLISNSVRGDISIINYLDTYWFKLIKPIEISCPNNPDDRGITAAFTMSAVDTFLDILQFSPVTEDKILFRKTMQTS